MAHLSILKKFFEILFPLRCGGCATPGTALCDRCTTQIPLAPYIEDPHTLAIFDYGHPIVARAIRKLKYNRKCELAQALTLASIEYITEYIQENIQGKVAMDIVLAPIPQHIYTRYERGFNQSELICKWIYPYLEACSIKHILQKKRATTSQAHTRTKSERANNVHRTMASLPCNKNTLYIIIDDVTTTGATFREARRVMKEMGAKYILAIALAHGYKNSL